MVVTPIWSVAASQAPAELRPLVEPFEGGDYCSPVPPSAAPAGLTTIMLPAAPFDHHPKPVFVAQ
jgi:hypothetical protein